MTITEISVEKVKDTQTGGTWSGKYPVELRIKRGLCGFMEVGSVDEKIQQDHYDQEREAKNLDEAVKDANYVKMPHPTAEERKVTIDLFENGGKEEDTPPF